MANKGNHWIQQEKSPPLHKKSKSCALDTSYGEIVFPHNEFLETQIFDHVWKCQVQFYLDMFIMMLEIFHETFLHPKWT